jgi:hypothetical protein
VQHEAVRFLLVAATSLALLGACSSHTTPRGSIRPSPPTITTPGVRTDRSVDAPTADDQFVCSKEAASNVAFMLGGRAVKVSKPVWANGRYSCDYRYVAAAGVAVSVNDFLAPQDAISYFDQRHRQLGTIDTTATAQCHPDCYVTPTGLALLRNGSQVLFVDASRLPSPSVGRNRAENAVTVLGSVVPP